MQANPYQPPVHEQPPVHALGTGRRTGNFTTLYILAAIFGLYASLTWNDGLVAKPGDLLEPHVIAVFAGFAVLAFLASLMPGRLHSDRISSISQLACRLVGGISLGLLPRQLQMLSDHLIASGVLPDLRGGLTLFLTIMFAAALSAVGIECVLRRVASATRPVALRPPR